MAGGRVSTRFVFHQRGVDQLARDPGAQEYSLDAARLASRAAHRESSSWENESGKHVGVFYRAVRSDEAGEAEIRVGGFWHMPEFGISTHGARHPLQRGCESVGLRFRYGRG